MFKVKDLTKYYGKNKVLKEISFTLNQGDLVGLVGLNGSGKTTLLRCITGTLNADNGEVILNEESLSANEFSYKKQIGYVPDGTYINNKITGIHFLNFVADIYEVEVDIRRMNIEKYGKLFGIYDYLEDNVSRYSKGMKQKLLITSALIHESDLLILDEPFTALDPISVRALKDILKEKAKDSIVIYSTHNLDTAEKICNKYLLIMLHSTLFHPLKIKLKLPNFILKQT